MHNKHGSGSDSDRSVHPAAVEPSGLRLTTGQKATTTTAGGDILRLVTSDATKRSDRQLAADNDTLVAHLKGDGSNLVRWLTVRRLHTNQKILSKWDDADESRTVRVFVEGLANLINKDVSTLYRWIERTKNLVALIGEAEVNKLAASIVNNDVRFLIKVTNLKSKVKALDVIGVYTEGKGKKAATKMLARAIHAETMAGLRHTEAIGGSSEATPGSRSHVFYGDVLARIHDVPARSAQCVVTSVPFYNVRDYGTRSWFGGTPTCEHVKNQDSTCSACGAWYGQLGLEPSVDLYIPHMVAVFRAVREHALRDDGTLWLEIDDSYSGSGRGPTGISGRGNHSERQGFVAAGVTAPEMPPKNKMLVPERLVLALQADGWIVRNQIPWVKTTCLGEAVTDRLSHAHSTIYMLTQNGHYYFDAVPLMEPSVTHKPRGSGGNKVSDNAALLGPRFKKSYHDSTNKYGVTVRYPRDVWIGPVGHYPGAHTAVFPEWLPEKCILAGTSARGACKSCGAPWVRVLDKPEPIGKAPSGSKYKSGSSSASRAAGRQAMRGKAKYERGERLGKQPHDVLPAPETIGWEPTCKCECKDVVPNIVLDVFAGTGTTLAVAMKLGRDYLGIELNERDYHPLIEKRLAEAKAEVERQKSAAAGELTKIIRADSGKTEDRKAKAGRRASRRAGSPRRR
jgi:hypothetical protein